MKNYLLICFSLIICTVYSQDGDTISNAINVDGVNVSTSFLDYNSATDSGLSPSCNTSEDVFYKHTVATGNNKMTFGMTSAGISVDVDVHYQLFMAPLDNVNQLQQLKCSFYYVVALSGGSFEFVVDDINSENTYYLRAYKISDTGGTLAELMNNTTITMRSEYDASLSVQEERIDNIKLIMNEEKLNLINNKSFNAFEVYSLNGKKVSQNESYEVIQSIDLSNLKNNVYIIVFSDGARSSKRKFIKK